MDITFQARLPLLQLAEPVEGGIDDRRDPFWISVPRAVEEGVHDPHPCDESTQVRAVHHNRAHELRRYCLPVDDGHVSEPRRRKHGGE